MESMIERVARVLEPQAWAAAEQGDSLAYKNRRTASLRKARAAIEAMRRPPRHVIDAAYAAHDAYEDAPEPKAWCGLTSAFDAMIDAALKEQV